MLFSAEQKELASLKQLFVLNAPKISSALRSKSEANSERNIALLVGVYEKYIHLKQRSAFESSMGGRRKEDVIDRPLVEEREEKSGVFRKERKAV